MTIKDKSPAGSLLKILVVDDEAPIKKILKSVLEKEGFEIFTADNVSGAKEVIALEPFSAVISDINMPGGVGWLELLEYIRKEHPTLPVILMTGFAKAHAAKEAFDLGVKAFLAKPFKREELLGALRNECGLGGHTITQDKPEEDTSANYCRVGIDQFISGKTMKFEIFIRLGENKFTKVAHEGENIDPDRVVAFKKKGIDFLYLKTSDFANYVGFNLALSRAAKNSRTISSEKKLQLAKHASAVIMENLFINGVNQDNFNQAKEITETTLSLLASAPECFDLLSALRSNGDYIYAHSLGVSLYGTLIAKEIGWDSPSTIFKVSTAGLFHDIGLKEIDRVITEKARTSLNVEEIKIFETHPGKGAEILSGMPSISSDILQAVLQHHETADGRGYPGRLHRGKIIPIARLIAVADGFCELALAGPNSQGLPASEAMGRLCVIHGDSLDSKFLNALKSVIGLSV